jgi:hypothetical protein
MALFSEVDWLVLLGVAAMLLLGPQGKGTLRMLGRWYAKALNLKDELLGEISSSAGVPVAALTSRPNLRGYLLGSDSLAPEHAGPAIPAAVTAAPAASLTSVAVRLEPVATSCSVSALGPGSWSWAASVPPPLARAAEPPGGPA